jgi:hypothetical protein
MKEQTWDEIRAELRKTELSGGCVSQLMNALRALVAALDGRYASGEHFHYFETDGPERDWRSTGKAQEMPMVDAKPDPPQPESDDGKLHAGWRGERSQPEPDMLRPVDMECDKRDICKRANKDEFLHCRNPHPREPGCESSCAYQGAPGGARCRPAEAREWVEENAMTDKPQPRFWMVWNPFSRAPTYKHYSEQAARDEAERLAKLNPADRFYVLASVAMVETRPLVWVETGDGLPF